MPCQRITVEPGEVMVAMGQLRIAVPPAVRLEGAGGLWLEAMPETLKEHFEEVR